MLRVLSSIVIILLILSPAISSPRGIDGSRAEIVIYPDRVVSSLHETLFGMNVHTHDKNNMKNPEFIERVRMMGIKSCRFPNGCESDLYNWKNPAPNQATVDEVVEFCDAIDSETYYTLNLQGGTEGLEVPVPEGAPLEEIIKYRHVMPNPCGNTNYYFGTLAETLELVQKYTIDRALAGKRPILHYEMGNENWGQSRTDWPPDVYAKTVEVYSRAMRSLLDDAKKKHPELAGLDLYIVAVGYPVMGNNMQMVDTPDRSINLAWTGALNKLYREKLINAVQEHFYPYASANGGALVWSAHNLHNIIYARKNLANPRLNGYRDPSISYDMPMEFTEWNVKCWGPQFAGNVQLVNGGFEEGLEGWKVEGGSVRPVSWAARRGAKGLRVEVKDGESCEISQTFDCPEKVLTFVAGLWVRTDNAEAVKVSFNDANDGKVLGGWGSRIDGMWERVVASAKMPENGGKVELVLSVDKPALVYLDEVMLYNTKDERGQCPISALTFEQQLFCVDALRQMALGDSPRTHLHHLTGNYPCGAMTSDGRMKDNARVYEFFTGYTGSEILKSDLRCENFKYYSAGNPWATEFNALAPDRDDVPMLGSMVTRKGDMLYILLINRTSDRNIEVSIDLGAEPAADTASVRTLSGTDIDVAGAKITDNSIKAARKLSHTITPYKAEIISVRLAQ